MYLLSTQCLLDRITGQAPASIDALPAREIHLSAVSLGQALLAIEQSPAGERQGHRDALRGYVGMVRSFDNIVPFDEKAAMLWPGLRAQKLIATNPAGAVIPVSEATTMVVASALATKLVFVDYPQPYHSGVSGLTVVNP